jgi:hypothetical protein
MLPSALKEKDCGGAKTEASHLHKTEAFHLEQSRPLRINGISRKKKRHP